MFINVWNFIRKKYKSNKTITSRTMYNPEDFERIEEEYNYLLDNFSVPVAEKYQSENGSDLILVKEINGQYFHTNISQQEPLGLVKHIRDIKPENEPNPEDDDKERMRKIEINREEPKVSSIEDLKNFKYAAKRIIAIYPKIDMNKPEVISILNQLETDSIYMRNKNYKEIFKK